MDVVSSVEPRAVQFLRTAKELVLSDDVNKVKSEYSSLVRGLPALLHQSGVFETIAYLESRSRRGRETAHGLVLEHLSRLLAPVTDLNQLTTHELTRMQVNQYLLVSRLALEAASWLKRMVEIQFGDEEEPHA
ncbi:type III-B CRISPR module-associated protein Cmr5 [Alicyclobacillus fructus]|uniref:type III-B CRISPR module-associated protein Cmr5 n=1 Tax=Alicyclobacillus fructus TaxID=2816082 RepID=UPI002E2BA703|nr:type III-B CRISPR module-associated protein Cmr5 [Alicyclobacillus fructus]